MVNIMVRPYLHGNTIIIPIINLNTLFTQPGVVRHKVRCVFSASEFGIEARDPKFVVSAQNVVLYI